MALTFLIDENVHPAYATQIRKLEPSIVTRIVGEPGTPDKGTRDPEILNWCEKHNFLLVTNNRTSMPVHLGEHLSQGGHVPGILILNPNLTIGQNLAELILIGLFSFDGEYQDQIVNLPLSR
ncbi:MAG: DUF5615 family PIN-like protein [Stigonema ocellatum SAG 48.90 = DSM 106950]|nr:DUF5615 family PIN-like protein [Stigonema ocellatum SAG 48.90 = DSM 106950]